MALPTAELPVIDIQPLLYSASHNEPKRRKVAEQIVTACASHGAFYAQNSGISATEQQAAFNMARMFFSQKQRDKETIAANAADASRGFSRGYLGMGAESGSADLCEVKEGFAYGYDWSAEQRPENPLQGPNVWPCDNLAANFSSSSFRNTLGSVYTLCYRASQAIAEGLADALQAPELLAACREGSGETISLMQQYCHHQQLKLLLLIF